MESEIKFRAWNKKKKKMIYNVDLYCGGLPFEGTKDNPYDFDKNTLGQYTGLKDKKGKEIYEGDVVKKKEAGWREVVGVVRFGEFQTDGCSDCTGDLVFGWYIKTKQEEEFSLDNNVIIIGNIYENKNLI